MNDQPKLYIAGMGMITPVGFDVASTAAAVKAGVSGYVESGYFTQETQQPITMARVPDEVFLTLKYEIEEGNHYSSQADRIIKMAILALREAIADHKFTQPIPLLLAMPEALPNTTYVGSELFIENLLKQKEFQLRSDQIHCIRVGRAGGIQGLELARQYLHEQGADYVLLGGSDSYGVYPRLGELDAAQRLLAPENKDGFAPGEGAGFVLLTRHSHKAVTKNGYTLVMSLPGNAQESGHFASDKPYRGDGLDKAFKQALEGIDNKKIHTIFSSLNGEQFWAKEYGVAYLRNQKHFRDNVAIEHPADCFGDLGAATGPVLIGLAAEHLMKTSDATAHLVYSSSDGPWRAAVRVEKQIQTTGL